MGCAVAFSNYDLPRLRRSRLLLRLRLLLALLLRLRLLRLPPPPSPAPAAAAFAACRSFRASRCARFFSRRAAARAARAASFAAISARTSISSSFNSANLHARARARAPHACVIMPRRRRVAAPPAHFSACPTRAGPADAMGSSRACGRAHNVSGQCGQQRKRVCARRRRSPLTKRSASSAKFPTVFRGHSLSPVRCPNACMHACTRV